ncbi:MAG: RNA polymerase sigma factor [Pirellulales bacterium]
MNEGRGLERDLRSRLATGDSTAFAELYDACADRIHHFLVVFLGSRSDADDALQETFLRVARVGRGLLEIENLRAFLFHIARNEGRRLIERRTRESDRRDHSLTADDLFVVDEAGSMASRERAEWVAAAFSHLEPELREVIELKVYGELTLREIAEAVGIPPGTAATRYRRALELLRSLLAEEDS